MNEEIKVIKDRIADLEAQLAALEAEERQGLNYVTWCGGDCPVYEHATVHVVYREGVLHSGVAAYFCWEHLGRDEDIIAYKLGDDPSKEEGWPKRGNIYYSGGEARFWNDTWLDSYLYGEGLVFATKAEDARYWEGRHDE